MVKLKISYIFLLLLARVLSTKKFQMNLVRELSRNYASSENFLMAPFAISRTLAMMYLQKDRRRDYQLANALRVTGQSPDRIISYFSEAYKKATKQQFLMGNVIFNSADFPVSPYMRKMSERLNVDMEKVNFSSGQKAVKEISSWLGKAIDKPDCPVLSKDTLTDKTKIVAVQGVSVTTLWKHRFQSMMKKPLTISKPNKRPVVTRKIDMMYTSGPFDYLVRDDIRGLKIPFSNNDISLVILHPRQKISTQQVLENLDKYLTLPMQPTNKTHLYLPAFTLQTTLDEAEALKNLGIKKVFTETANNTIIKQHNILIVKANRHLLPNEYQSEDDLKVVIVNQPFVFVIMNQKAIYMAGRVDSITDLLKI